MCMHEHMCVSMVEYAYICMCIGPKPGERDSYEVFMESICPNALDWISVFPKNSYVEILTHDVMVLGDGLYED